MIQGGTHYEWSLLPTFPATNWIPLEINPGAGSDGWGQPLAQHYTLAWMDRWLKKDGEVGFADADDRLLADADWRSRLSFHFFSKRDFPNRAGDQQRCDNTLVGCD